MLDLRGAPLVHDVELRDLLVGAEGHAQSQRALEVLDQATFWNMDDWFISL